MNKAVKDLRRPQTSHGIAENIRSDYAALQAKVPPGERMLVSLDYACILDFKRNPIWLADMPGCAGLPPGGAGAP